MGGTGRRWVSGLCQDRVWPTGGQTLHQPRQTNVGQRSILLNLRNYLIILLSSSRYLKKPENLNMSSFFHAFHHHIQNCSYSQLISYIHVHSFVQFHEWIVFYNFLYAIVSPCKTARKNLYLFFGSQIWKNDLWYVHGRNRQTGPGEATEAWTSVRRERIRRTIHQGALLHKICFRNWKVHTLN